MLPDKKAIVLPAPMLIINAGNAQHIIVLVELNSRKKSMNFFIKFCFQTLHHYVLSFLRCNHFSKSVL